ncbi:MAG: hypothetical protein ASARMPRED_002925 [Alectoria sarmentosa]|nr:MAG: hypothetical protein ASARMPRED_002925 [Alectoria sarmentosa]
MSGLEVIVGWRPASANVETTENFLRFYGRVTQYGETKFENAVFCVFRFDNVAEAQNAYMSLDDGTLLLDVDK